MSCRDSLKGPLRLSTVVLLAVSFVANAQSPQNPIDTERTGPYNGLYQPKSDPRVTEWPSCPEGRFFT
jgi:hypothetical protein